MNAHLLTGLIAALGLLANLTGIGEARAQTGEAQSGSHAGHAAHSGQAHAHADFVSERLHVRVDGDEDGRDIILIPGLSSSPEVWQETVDHLLSPDAASQDGRGWRVHRIHVQGFAGAPVAGNAEGPVAAPVAEEIARYIAENDLQQPVVVGHSMGGTMAMMLAARHPDLVGRLMVVDMVPFMGMMFGPPGTTAQTVGPIADQVAGGMASASPEAYQVRAAASVTGMIATEAKRAGPLADTAASDQQVVAHAMRELIATDLRPELPAITAPTEVLYVAFSTPGMTPEITDAIYQASFAALPGVTLKRIDDSAHFIMLDQPEAFQSELDAFLTR